MNKKITRRVCLGILGGIGGSLIGVHSLFFRERPIPIPQKVKELYRKQELIKQQAELFKLGKLYPQMQFVFPAPYKNKVSDTPNVMDYNEMIRYLEERKYGSHSSHLPRGTYLDTDINSKLYPHPHENGTLVAILNQRVFFIDERPMQVEVLMP